MKTFLLTTVLFFIALPASAAVISVTPDTIPLSGTSTIEISLDTEGELINALEFTLTFPEGVQLVAVHEGTSIVSFWTGAPAIENNSVTLAGIIPGGFRGTGAITALQIIPSHEGTIRPRISDISVLRNDGQGTPVPVTIGNQDITITSDAPEIQSAVDTTVPEPFTVSVISDSSISGGAYVAIFATQDKQTGVASYAIQETNASRPDDSLWITAESPYMLSDQTLSRNIFVRATDYAGNVRIAQWEKESNTTTLEKALYLMLSLIVVLLLFAFYVRHTHRKRIGL